MPHIQEEIIEEIRNRADLVDLVSRQTPVKKNGNAFWACCPFHNEKTPSFKIDPQRQTYYCFGCKKSGNVFHFVQDMVNTDFVGAVQWLANLYGIDIPDTRDGNEQEQDRRRQWRENCLKSIALFCGMPILGWICTILAMKKFSLTKEKMEEIQVTIAAKKTEGETEAELVEETAAESVVTE